LVQVNRRTFLKQASTVAMMASMGCAVAEDAALPTVKVPMKSGESLVAELYESLNEKQKKSLCFAFDHPLRSEVDNNWNIVDDTVEKAFDKDQQEMIRQIFMSLHSEEYAQKVFDQVAEDHGAEGLGDCSVALFGMPKEKFEFVLTGRHVTRRCDGNSVEGSAFGGPLFYGHATKGKEKKDHKGNAYWYQSKTANQVFQALDGKQRKIALCAQAPRREQKAATVKLRKEGFPGIACSSLSKDQKGLVSSSLADMLALFRKQDVTEAKKLIESAGGVDALHMAFYGQKYDIGKDEVWDVWQVEGPNMIWFFRGYPHVHAWIHIKA